MAHSLLPKENFFFFLISTWYPGYILIITLALRVTNGRWNVGFFFLSPSPFVPWHCGTAPSIQAAGLL